MNIVKKILLPMLLCLSFSIYPQVFDIPYKTDAPNRTLLLPAENAKAVVLLFPGGGGMLRLKDDGKTNNTHTFVRSKNEWAKYGISAVLVDTPYDLLSGDRNIRRISDHQQRVENIVQFYKDKLNLPIWLFGHSMGTVSASEFVNQEKEHQQLLAGIILAGTFKAVTIKKDVELPLLIIHHEEDSCISTPVSRSKNIFENRPTNQISKLVLLHGGTSSGDVCGALSHHGFEGIEGEFVKTAAEFISLY